MKKGLLLAWLICMLPCTLVSADTANVVVEDVPSLMTVTSIVIKGNVRISRASILARLGVKKGRELSKEKLNLIVKSLYATNLFAHVQVAFDDGELAISVQELPTVNSVHIDGNSGVDTTTLEKDLGIEARQILSKDQLRKSTMRISAIYRRMGYFKAEIQTQVIYRPQNRVDVIFHIKEGAASIVEDVIFIGNSAMKPSSLISTISTKPFRWWRFVKSGSLYDPGSGGNDVSLLKNYYYDRGYIDFHVISSTAQLSTLLESYTILYHLSEGNCYRVSTVSLVNEIPDVPSPSAIRYYLQPGKVYRRAHVVEDMGRLERYFARRGHPFVRVVERMRRDKENQLVAVEYVAQVIPRLTIRRVTIVGNRRTYDRVLYPLLDVWPGDILDERNIASTKRNLQRLGFFESVEIEKEPSILDPNAVDVRIIVKEQATGTLGIKGSYSGTLGGRVDINFDEANFFGKGYHFRVNAAIGGYSRDLVFTFSDPFCAHRNILAGVSLRWSSQTARDAGRARGRSEYKVLIKGARAFFAIPIRKYWSIRPGYGLSFERFQNVHASVYSVRKNQEWLTNLPRGGDVVVSKVSMGLAFDKRDRRFDATRGLFALLNLDVSGLGGNLRTWQLSLDLDYHWKISEAFTLRARAHASILRPWSERHALRVVDRYRLGGADSLRGFSEWGIGPRYFKFEAIGGDTTVGGTIEVLFPLGLPKESRFRGFVFLDFGTAWDAYANLPKDIFVNEKLMRLSVGVGIRWASPMGVISISYGIPLKKHGYDVEDRVNLGMKSAVSSQNDFL